MVTDTHNHTYTIDTWVAVTNFNVMTPQQAANTKPVPEAHVLLMNDHPEEYEHILSQLFHEQTKNDGKQKYPTPETCEDPSKLNEIEKRIYDEIITLGGKEQLKLNPTKTIEKRRDYFWKFNWVEFLLNEDKPSRVEPFLVKDHSIFSRNCLDIGINREFKVKLTPQHENSRLRQI